MSQLKTRNFLAAAALLMSVLACNGTPPAGQVEPRPTSTPIIFPTHAVGWLPNSDEEVPRVTVEDTFIAFANDEAIIVDVRDLVAYEDSHIAGAISIPLGVIETNLEGLGDLPDKDQWIITYCT